MSHIFTIYHNSGLEESKSHLISFSKPGTGHSVWRRAVSYGLGKYRCREVNYFHLIKINKK